MKAGQFVCLGNLQHLKNRFGKGYAVQIKVAHEKMNEFKEELKISLPGIEIEGIIFCEEISFESFEFI